MGGDEACLLMLCNNTASNLYEYCKPPLSQRTKMRFTFIIFPNFGRPSQFCLSICFTLRSENTCSQPAWFTTIKSNRIAKPASLLIPGIDLKAFYTRIGLPPCVGEMLVLRTWNRKEEQTNELLKASLLAASSLKVAMCKARPKSPEARAAEPQKPDPSQALERAW